MTGQRKINKDGFNKYQNSQLFSHHGVFSILWPIFMWVNENGARMKRK